MDNGLGSSRHTYFIEGNEITNGDIRIIICGAAHDRFCVFMKNGRKKLAVNLMTEEEMFGFLRGAMNTATLCKTTLFVDEDSNPFNSLMPGQILVRRGDMLVEEF